MAPVWPPGRCQARATWSGEELRTQPPLPPLSSLLGLFARMSDRPASMSLRLLRTFQLPFSETERTETAGHTQGLEAELAQVLARLGSDKQNMAEATQRSALAREREVGAHRDRDLGLSNRGAGPV